MLKLTVQYEDGQSFCERYGLPLDIGRDSANGLCIRAWRVARRHARITTRSGKLFFEDHGSLLGTTLNGRRVLQHSPLQEGDELVIGPCLIRVDGFSEQGQGQTDTELQCKSAAFAGLNASDAEEGRDECAVAMAMPAAAPLPASVPGRGHDTVVMPDEVSRAAWLALRVRFHQALIKALDLRRRDIASLSDEGLRTEALHVLEGLVQADTALEPSIDREQLIQDVVDEAVGLGPLEPLLADTAITEIMVNRFDEIYIESAGRLQRHDAMFSSEQAVLEIIDRIVAPLGRRVDESSPMVDARLKDGSRVNAVIAPVALRGASLTIRKFPVRRPGMADLLEVGALDVHMAGFLAACVAQRKNILVSGGTGSGKTTLLNILSNCIPPGERVVTIEDAAELQLTHAHRVSLEARPPNLEGRGRIEIRDLVRNALRMRPDRIVVGECRGAEAFDMLAAMNTGHEGSLTTLHANSPRDALSRLETMILMAGMDLPLVAVREHIAASINFVVQQARLPSGQRLITSIVEVSGTESGRILTQTLFEYFPGPPACFRGCGVMPESLGSYALAQAGLTADTFNQVTPWQASVTGFSGAAGTPRSTGACT
ncbi:MAG: ATPase, T2SS/T4P/T4SS family [Pusillimonas sp.]